MNRSVITIRSAYQEDMPTIMELIMSLAEYEKKLDSVIANEATVQKYFFGPDRFVKILLAFYHDQPAGFALYFYNFSTFIGKPGIYLEDFFVKAQYRRMKIGSLLFDRLIAIAQETHCFGIEFSVLTWNVDALAFYKKFNAKVKDEWDLYRITL